MSKLAHKKQHRKTMRNIPKITPGAQLSCIKPEQKQASLINSSIGIQNYMASPGGAGGKESACQCRIHRDTGSGRPPEVDNATPLQYSCLENSMGIRAWRTLQYMGLQRVGLK